MSDMHGITSTQAVKVLQQMLRNNTDTHDQEQIERYLALETAIHIIPKYQEDLDFRWEVRKRLESYKKQQTNNEVLSENGRWLAVKVIEECLHILDSCLLEYNGLTENEREGEE